MVNVSTTRKSHIDIDKIKQMIKDNYVLVGVPAEDADRGDAEKKAKGSRWRKSGNINNAELLYIHTHGVRAGQMREQMGSVMADGKTPYSKAYQMYIKEHGSPMMNVPPRPVIEPAIKAHKKEVAQKLANAYKHVLKGDESEFIAGLGRAGMYAQNIVRAWFKNPENNWTPIQDRTAKRKGSDNPLVDTGQLKKSITYVVKKGK